MMINKKENSLLIVLWILNLFMILATLLMRNVMHGTLYKISLIIVLIIFIINIKNQQEQKSILVILLALMAYAFFANLIRSDEKDFDFFIMMINFFNALLFFYCCLSINVSKKAYNCIFLTNIIISIVFIISYFVMDIDSEQSLIMGGYVNPNYLALWLSMNVMYLAMFFTNTKKLLLKLVTFILIICIMSMLYLTKARTSLLTTTIFLLGLLLIRKKRRVSNIAIFILTLAPLIFAISYVILYLTQGDAETVFLGKNFFTGRESIWIENYNLLLEKPFIGLYSEYYQNYVNMHNTFLTVLYYYGFVVFILFIIFLLGIVFTASKNINLKIGENEFKFNKIALYLFLIILFLGVGESTLLSMGTEMYIFAGSALAMCNYKQDN